MIETLTKNNLKFEQNFQEIFNKPELVQNYLTKRSNAFDKIIIKEILRREFSKSVLQNGSKREYAKRAFQDSSRSEFLNRGLDECPKKILKESAQRDFSKRVKDF